MFDDVAAFVISLAVMSVYEFRVIVELSCKFVSLCLLLYSGDVCTLVRRGCCILSL